MPIYEYKCNDCENIFEVLSLSSSGEEIIRCSNCKSEKVVKVLSAGSFRLGTGAAIPSAPSEGCGGNSGFS